jgi:predicted CopG family antitoxin
MKKLTISVDDDVYKNLYTYIGRGKISHFLNDMARDFISTHSNKSITTGKQLIESMAGKSSITMTTDDIMKLTRDY